MVLIDEAADLLERTPSLAHVVLDEAQDLSPLQWQMIDKMLSFPQVEEVTIAGDDDQAIYEWAGADPHGMAGFAER